MPVGEEMMRVTYRERIHTYGKMLASTWLSPCIQLGLYSLLFRVYNIVLVLRA